MNPEQEKAFEREWAMHCSEYPLSGGYGLYARAMFAAGLTCAEQQNKLARGLALVAALVKQQPSPQRFSEQTLTSSSGFAGIDGIFRFRSDGTNERGLAVLRVAPSGGQVISPAPRAFNPGT